MQKKNQLVAGDDEDETAGEDAVADASEKPEAGGAKEPVHSEPPVEANRLR